MDDLKRLAEAATPGPWRWAGNVDADHIELTTRDRGMLYVMRFVRWGMQSAQPMFQPLPIGSHTAMMKATEMPIFEVAPEATERSDPRVYRGDLIGLRHPDAQWIAAADPTTILALLDRLAAAESQREGLDVERLRNAWEKHQTVANLRSFHDCDPSCSGDIAARYTALKEQPRGE